MRVQAGKDKSKSGEKKQFPLIRSMGFLKDCDKT